MIPQTQRSLQTPVLLSIPIPIPVTGPAWQKQLAQAVRDPAELMALLGLPPSRLPAAAQHFPLRVPRGYIARMRYGDANDPLLRQVLPLPDEDLSAAGYSTDPVGDLHAHAAAGVLHKYHGRALLITTGMCAVHCRYCFRRHYPYADEHAARDDWAGALSYLRAHPEISEIILSGGDPLALPDHRLAALSARLAEIPHLTRLRIHTRLPVVIPERIDEPLLNWLSGSRLRPVMVLHINHPQEIDAALQSACARLRAAGVCLLNQSVLLHGVNDHADTLSALSEALFDAGVMPYYLHLLDPVQGATHFAVDEDVGPRLLAELQARLPGYLVPRLVREVAGAPHKMTVPAAGGFIA